MYDNYIQSELLLKFSTDVLARTSTMKKDSKDISRCLYSLRVSQGCSITVNVLTMASITTSNDSCSHSRVLIGNNEYPTMPQKKNERKSEFELPNQKVTLIWTLLQWPLQTKEENTEVIYGNNSQSCSSRTVNQQ